MMTPHVQPDVTGRAMRPRSSARSQLRQVIFLGAPLHSGSTLLGLMLGAHSSIFYCGEGMCAVRMGHADTPLFQRWCRLCGPACPVWSGWRGDPDGLYEFLASATGKQAVFDSSKSTTWVRGRREALPSAVEAHLIVLCRDGRAVVNSFRRKYRDTPVSEHATRWVEKVQKVEAIASVWGGPVHRVRYEELATDSTAVLMRLCGGLGHAFETAMAAPWLADVHPLDANPGPLLMFMAHGGRAPVPGVLDATRGTTKYTAGRADVLLDERWRQEMSREELAVFDRVAGRQNARYAWP